jgi:hypothetical protein
VAPVLNYALQHEDVRESELLVGEWSALRSGRFTALVLFERRLGGPYSRCGRRGEVDMLDLTGTRKH